jgi:peptidoglycan/LPS O-acetylase OafA/YrhL
MLAAGVGETRRPATERALGFGQSHRASDERDGSTVDLNKLSTADKVIGLSAVAFLIAMFLPWYGLDFGDLGSGSNSGWDYFLTGILPLLIVLIMVAQIALSRFSDTELPQPPIPWSRVHLVAGAVVAVLLILRTIIGSSEGSGAFEVDLDRMYGLWVALAAALGVGVGGFLKDQEAEDVVAGPTTAPPTTPY